MKYFIKKFIFYFIFTLSLASHTDILQAQNPPDFLCAYENGNDVELQWTSVQGYCPGGTFTGLNIYRAENQNGPYTLIHTESMESTTLFLDITANPNTTIYYYYLELNCGTSTSISDTLSTLFPKAPNITKLSVDGDKVTIEWGDSPSPEAYGYIIYREDDNGNLQPLDTIYDPATRTYTDLTAEALTKTEGYRIATFDFCSADALKPNPGPDNGVTYYTVFYTAVNNDCSGVLDLNWNEYSGHLTDIFYHIQTIEYNNGIAINNNIDNLPNGTSNTSYQINQGIDSVEITVNIIDNMTNAAVSESNSLVVYFSDTNALTIFA